MRTHDSVRARFRAKMGAEAAAGGRGDWIPAAAGKPYDLINHDRRASLASLEMELVPTPA